MIRTPVSSVRLCIACLCLALGCGSRAPEKSEPSRAGQASPPPAPPPPDPDALDPAGDLPPGRRALQVVHGAERVVDGEQARARGLTLVDLSDDWAPAIFQDGAAADGTALPNRYRPIYDGLASDRTDGDGQPLRPGEKNYLELYGIPPSLSALHARFLADGDRPCFAAVDTARLLAVQSIPSWGAASEKKELARAKERAERLAQAGVSDAGADALAADPKLAKELKAHQQFEAERAAFAQAEKRLDCEGLLDTKNHMPGSYDTPMRFAMLAFQRKNVVMAEADITRGTLEALARSPLENAFLALQRTLAERAADAGGFIEDGSAGGRDLIGEATSAVMARLGVQTPADALAFFRRRRPQDFTWLRAAVRLPEAPEYYAAHMDLAAEIDRGDVWYDFPFDGKGERLPQPRSRYPSFTLFVRHQGQKLPLVRWRTTIGSWRTELASDGQEYLRYKDSDVGPRVWRHVVAAPVWVPYASSPVGGMVKEKWVNGALMKVTNYDEVGPGYLSAYGLVAGVHVEPRARGFFDNGIRTHGTFDYTSLRGRFSHGCHRLQNNLAVRMFSFVVRHRRHRVLGQMALDSRRSFWWHGEVFDLRLPTRGYYFELEPPLPVETLPGQIKGKLQKPVAGYVRKPGQVYTASSPPAAPGGPEAKAGGAAAAAAGEP